MKVSYRFGLISSVVTITIYLIAYLVNKKMMLGPLTFWLTWVIVLVFMGMACKTERDATDKIYPFKTALRTAFQVYLINTVAFSIFYHVLLLLFDPGLVDLQMEINLEWSKWLGEKVYQMDPNDPAYQELEQIDNTITLGTILFSLGRSIIAGFVLAYIIGMAYRREFNIDGTEA